MPGREATLLMSRARSPGSQVTLIAQQRPSIALDLVVLLDPVAGILVVLGAAYLVWLRPGADDLGLLRLCDGVQSRPVVPVLRLAQQWPGRC